MLIIPSLTLLVWYAGALLSSIYGSYHSEWLPDYVNVLSEMKLTNEQMAQLQVERGVF